MAQHQTRDTHYRKVYRADRWAGRFIKMGGYGIILSILAIMLFLIYQSMPLAKGASLTNLLNISAPTAKSRVLLSGVDSYLEVIYTLDENGIVRFYNAHNMTLLDSANLGLGNHEKILTAVRGSLSREIFAVGTDSGQVITAEINMVQDYQENQRRIIPNLEVHERWTLQDSSDSSVVQVKGIAFAQNEDMWRYWAVMDQSGRVLLKIYDADEESEYEHRDFIKPSADAQISAMTLSNNGENLIVGYTNGMLQWYGISDAETVSLKDEWRGGYSQITALHYLIGDQSLVIADADGSVSVSFPVRSPSNIFKFVKVHDFSSHDKAVSGIAVSPRNRNFLTFDVAGGVKLHYSTTGKTQLGFQAGEYPVSTAAFSPKSNAITVVDQQQRLALYRLDNPHPEAGFKAFFGKVWYEGYPKAEFVWQSTGGSDEFEPKLSLIPLIFGTLKGTIYAMFFSIPLAILAAIYVSQFAPVRLARVVKPTVEIMAALPSVVIGFLAGLYFSPYFEDHLMTAMLFMFWLPVMFALGIVVWQLIPTSIRTKLPGGAELLYLTVFVVIALWLSLGFESTMENLLFDGNFQQWLYAKFNVTYETRNSLVVGFALGFAVIPIIFTVSEDALSNVPKSLSSAALALGASRWQTVRKIVIPAASGGIFAAIMLGLGRAVGETMIVLMATGNTPIIDWSPFNGFRAMSANIAVEIPEAPVGGTLYRVLFLTALLLFAFTFVLNTLSSLIGDRLRKKYARF